MFAQVEGEGEETLDPSLSRMYRTGTEETLDALVEVLQELGIKIDEVDEGTGRIESKKTRYRAKRFEGLSIPPPSSAYGGSKIRLESFVVYATVSPFAEPARVHVTSRISFARYELARSLLESAGREVPTCLASTPKLREHLGVAERPVRLEGFSPKLSYREPDARRENEGAVVITGWVLEDGHFTPSGLTRNDTDRHGQHAIVADQ